jgi:hypothetical protein
VIRPDSGLALIYEDLMNVGRGSLELTRNVATTADSGFTASNIALTEWHSGYTMELIPVRMTLAIPAITHRVAILPTYSKGQGRRILPIWSQREEAERETGTLVDFTRSALLAVIVYLKRN